MVLGAYRYEPPRKDRRKAPSATQCRVAAIGLNKRDEAVRFDPDLLEVSGTPIVVLQDVGADPMGDAWFSLSGEGTLGYIPVGGGIAARDTVPEVILLKNWSEELKRLMPPDPQ